MYIYTHYIFIMYDSIRNDGNMLTCTCRGLIIWVIDLCRRCYPTYFTQLSGVDRLIANTPPHGPPPVPTGSHTPLSVDPGQYYLPACPPGQGENPPTSSGTWGSWMVYKWGPMACPRSGSPWAWSNHTAATDTSTLSRTPSLERIEFSN